MSLALFDLDHTLVQADTPRLWFSFLMDKGVLPRRETTDKANRFTEDYRTGNLNYPDYMHFELAALKDNATKELHIWRNEFQVSHLRPNISQKARDLLNTHRDAGDTVVIITASNRFIAEAAAKEMEVAHLIATEPELINEQFTGEFFGAPCFKEGKIEKLEQWLTTSGTNREETWFYSDSINDLPLLEQATHPVVVNPDELLKAIALERKWPSADLIDG